MDIWELLEIEPTTDKKTIRKAYAARTRVIHPEEKPEEFKVLRMAYEAALKYAEYAAGRGDVFESPGENETKEDALTDERSINPHAEDQTQEQEESDHSELFTYFTDNQAKQKQRVDTFMQHWKELKNPSGDSEEAKWWKEYLESEDFRSIQWNTQIVSLIAEEIDDKFFYSTNEMKIWFWEAYGFQADDEEKYQGELQKLWKCLYMAYEHYENVLLAKEFDRKSKRNFRIFAVCAVACVFVVIGIIVAHNSKTMDNERNFIMQCMTEQYPGTDFSVPERSEQGYSDVTYTMSPSAHPELLITVKVEYLHWDDEYTMQITEEDYGVQLLEYYASEYGLNCGRMEYGEDGFDSRDKELYGILFYSDIEQLGTFCETVVKMFDEQEELQAIPAVGICAWDVAFPEVLIQGGVDDFPFADVQLYDLRTVGAAELEATLEEVYMVYMFQYESWKLTPQQYREWGDPYEKVCEQWEDYEGFWYNVQDEDTGDVLCRLYVPTYEYIDGYRYTDDQYMPAYKQAITSGNAYYFLLDYGAYIIVDKGGRGYTVQPLQGSAESFGMQPEERVDDLTALLLESLKNEIKTNLNNF